MRTAFYPTALHGNLNNHTYHKRPSMVQFASINAGMIAQDLTDKYQAAFQANPAQHKLSTSTTWLFREPGSCKAIADIVKDGKPTAITILGSSDNSEPLSYGIAISAMNIPFKDPKQLKIIAVEPEADLHAIAKTGYLVCSDFEKYVQFAWNTPLKENWDKYLKFKKEPPKIFASLIEKYPRMAEYTRDLIQKTGIGKGLSWYRINRETVPPIYVENARMEEHVKRRPSPHQRQVYIMANSWIYLLAKNTRNVQALELELSPDKVSQFMKVIVDMKKQNAGKEVWIVVGEMEKAPLNQDPILHTLLLQQGMKPLSIDELKQAGISSPNPQELENLQGKIWKLST